MPVESPHPTYHLLPPAYRFHTTALSYECQHTVSILLHSHSGIIMSNHNDNYSSQHANSQTSNVEAVVQILLTRLQAMEEKIKSQEEKIKSQDEEIKRLRNKNQKKIKTSSKTQINNDQQILFDTNDGEFSNKKLIRLREDNDIDGIKRYISAYYAKVLDAHFVVKYCKTENKYDFIDDYIFKTKILKPLEIFLDEQESLSTMA
jgi:hypothetical protein